MGRARCGRDACREREGEWIVRVGNYDLVLPWAPGHVSVVGGVFVVVVVVVVQLDVHVPLLGLRV
jgi:hypothetical protein